MRNNRVIVKTEEKNVPDRAAFYLLQGLPLLLLLPLIMSFTEARYSSKQLGKLAEQVAAGDFARVLDKWGFSLQPDPLMTEATRTLDNCVNLYSSEKSFSMDVEYSVFYNPGSFDKPDDVEMGRIIRDKDDFYQEEMGNIKVINKKYELIVNKRSEYITVSERQKEKLEPVNFQTDSLMKFIAHVERTAEGFCYYMDEGAIEKFEVITDKEGYLKTWRTWYRDEMDFGNGKVKVVTQMSYLNFTKKPKISRSQFSLDPFITIGKKGDVTAKEKYKAYYVMNQLTQK